MAALGVVLLAAMSAMGPAVWAAANNQNDPTRQGLFIEQVIVNDCPGSTPASIEIVGKNMNNGDHPVVKFGDSADPVGLLNVVVTEGGTRHTADSTGCVGDLALLPGDYRVQVYTGPSVQQYDAYDLTIVQTGVAAAGAVTLGQLCEAVDLGNGFCTLANVITAIREGLPPPDDCPCWDADTLQEAKEGLIGLPIIESYICEYEPPDPPSARALKVLERETPGEDAVGN
jgi:hypothetical protein